MKIKRRDECSSDAIVANYTLSPIKFKRLTWMNFSKLKYNQLYDCSRRTQANIMKTKFTYGKLREVFANCKWISRVCWFNKSHSVLSRVKHIVHSRMYTVYTSKCISGATHHLIVVMCTFLELYTFCHGFCMLFEHSRKELLLLAHSVEEAAGFLSILHFSASFVFTIHSFLSLHFAFVLCKETNKFLKIVLTHTHTKRGRENQTSQIKSFPFQFQINTHDCISNLNQTKSNGLKSVWEFIYSV